MSARALVLSRALDEFGEMAIRPLTAAITVKQWKNAINQRLNRWVPWTGRRYLDIQQTSKRYGYYILLHSCGFDPCSVMFMTLAETCVLFTFYCCTDRSKRGLFHRANWNANTYQIDSSLYYFGNSGSRAGKLKFPFILP